MANLKTAMKIAKEMKKSIKVTESMTEKAELKVNISVRVDHEVLEWLKKRGADVGMPYQSFLNLILNVAMRQNVDPSRMFVADADTNILQRIEKLEKAVAAKAK